ncbi:MAG TPA: cytochrome c [Parafilimonas sp.]|nr:cytochrome c [Parafilimonas sp.]
MKKQILFISAIIISSLFIYSCGGGAGSSSTTESSASTADDNASADNPSYDPDRGTGRFTTVDVGEHLDAAMADEGKKVFDVKCAACHKLTDEKLVGPGWQGVTSRHQPVWIMNFTTNPDEMLNKDPKAQAMLEICLVRMPNQNLSDAEARSVLEFMRKNDGVK